MADNDIETIRVIDKRDRARGPMIMNKSDFDGQKDQYEEYQDPGGVTMPNQGLGVDPLGRNTSGTYSKPTPSDIRYPDKDVTEFENNHGAFVKRDAASMRETMGQPPLPGGVFPQAPDGVGPDQELPIQEVPAGEGGTEPGQELPEGQIRAQEGTRSLGTKGEDGKWKISMTGLSDKDIADFNALNTQDYEKRLQWISQKRALQRKPLPTMEEVEKAAGGSGKNARRRDEQQRRPGQAQPAQPTSPGTPPPPRPAPPKA